MIYKAPKSQKESGRKYGGRCKQRAIIFYRDRVIPLWSLH